MNKYQEILKVVTEYYGVSFDRIKSKSRYTKDNTLEARHMFLFLMYTNTDYPLTSIGRLLGRDHTAVIHAADSINDQTSVKYHTKEKENYEKIKELLSFQVQPYKRRTKIRELLLQEF